VNVNSTSIPANQTTYSIVAPIGTTTPLPTSVIVMGQGCAVASIDYFRMAIMIMIPLIAL